MAVPKGLPDGTWFGTQLPNGTVITTSLSNPSMPPIVEHHDLSDGIEARGTGTGACLGYQLDPPSVDRANVALQEHFGVEGISFCSNNLNNWYGETLNNVLVYYCIDSHYACTVVNGETIREGMAAMDRLCQHYEASWALDGSDADGVRFLMGKCRTTPTTSQYICH